MAIEKKYLTFDELLARWDCEKKDIHYMIMEGELIPSIFWSDHAYSYQWQPNPKEFGGLLLCTQYDEYDLVQCEPMHKTFHLKLPTKTGVSRYFFKYGTLGLYDEAEEFGKSWYKLAAISSHSQADAIINQDDIECRCVFMIEDIDFREVLGDIPARLNAVVVNEKPKYCLEDFESGIESEFNDVYGELKPNKQTIIFDKTSSTYPPELDLAIQAWQEVSSIEGKGKPKARIRKWLDDNTKLSNTAKERIEIIANWEKLGGATSTD